MNIEQAREYVWSRVQGPALAHPNLPVKLRNKIVATRKWFSSFRHIGDLLVYLDRFESGNESETYRAMKALDLTTFEDVVDEFKKKFLLSINDCTRPSDFVIGECYSAFDILIFAGVYDTRAGGIFILGNKESPEGMVIKATLDGKYPNEWLRVGSSLKYFLKSINGKFDEKYEVNRAIIDHPELPIYTFVRKDEKSSFRYFGAFNFISLNSESDGSKWFRLDLSYTQSSKNLTKIEYLSALGEESTAYSTETTREERLARLRNAPKKPLSVQTVATTYMRNADVIAEVLDRAAGKCESCFQPAPFVRKSDGTPYLEVHHIVQLAHGGDDTVENAIAVCPNCHRRKHFG